MAQITVQNTAFVHDKDVDVGDVINAKPINEAMETCVNLAVAALREPPPHYTEFQSRQIGALLTSMRWTHRAIRKILGFEGDDKTMAVDGLALARVPLEGLYAVCLMLESPDWVDCYLRDGWKKQYQRFLLQCAETVNLPRFDEFGKKSGPKTLDILRQFLGITDAQVATINHEEKGVAMPAGLKKEPIDRFPTPSGVLARLPDGDKRRMLRRLYPEYVWLCSFVHGLSEATTFKVLSDPNSDLKLPTRFDSEEQFHRNVREPAYLISLLSLIQSATEISALYKGDVSLAASVVKAWQEVSEGALLGRAIWALRAKCLLGVL